MESCPEVLSTLELNVFDRTLGDRGAWTAVQVLLDFRSFCPCALRASKLPAICLFSPRTWMHGADSCGLLNSDA